MMQKLQSEVECKRAATRLNDLLAEIFEYGRRKRLILRPFTAYEKLAETWVTYPEGWEGNVLGMLAAFAVCGNTKTCAPFLRSAGDRLSAPDVALVRRVLPGSVGKLFFYCEVSR